MISYAAALLAGVHPMKTIYIYFLYAREIQIEDRQCSR